MQSILRACAALSLAASLIALQGLPVCSSSACPMRGADLEACKKMDWDCCQARGGQVSHPPNVAAPAAATMPAGLALAVPGEPRPSHLAAPFLAVAPSVVQGIGLFTLFAVFLI